jgi:excisionase family DNA binding protein
VSLSLNGRTFYSVGEACEQAGISRDTFLRWVRQGKFSDVEYRDRNGWRLFTESDLHTLKTRVNHVDKIAKKSAEKHAAP